jgi:hypothetical protein
MFEFLPHTGTIDIDGPVITEKIDVNEYATM